MAKLFTSESVGPGHPDKICDQVSDAILDACMAQDPMSRVACECFTTNELFVVGGEITTTAKVNYEEIVRNTLRKIGYTDKSLGIGADTCKVQVVITTQSPDIAQGVNKALDDNETGAGDQGIMFGYATDETPAYMPLPIFLSHRLVERADVLRKSGEFKYARPDMKSQVTVDYADPTNIKIVSVLMSIQHDPDFKEDEFKAYIKENVIDYVMKQYNLNLDYSVLINPTGRFVVGGPEGDTGLTGRKIIVDTYGGTAAHGGGAFSGKDCTKVDRSAAYMARYIAKNLVAAGVAERLQIQLAYAIGVSQPTSINVKGYESAKYSYDEIVKCIRDLFPLTPNGIINCFDLRRPIYEQTATYGHFGRDDLDLPWEKLDKVEQIKSYFGL
jgi:S-adenosylmethionine synthetase